MSVPLAQLPAEPHRHTALTITGTFYLQDNRKMSTAETKKGNAQREKMAAAALVRKAQLTPYMITKRVSEVAFDISPF